MAWVWCTCCFLSPAKRLGWSSRFFTAFPGGLFLSCLLEKVPNRHSRHGRFSARLSVAAAFDFWRAGAGIFLPLAAQLRDLLPRGAHFFGIRRVALQLRSQPALSGAGAAPEGEVTQDLAPAAVGSDRSNQLSLPAHRLPLHHAWTAGRRGGGTTAF